MAGVHSVAGIVDVLASAHAFDIRCVDGEGKPCMAADLDAQASLSDMAFDSRAARPGTLFVCKGAAFREQYLLDAVARGAVCYLAQEPHPACGIGGIVVSDVRRAMALAADAFFGHPSGELDLIAITGTKGKTTVAFYIDAILRARACGKPSALITGVVCDDGRSRVHSHNTTPESVELQAILSRAVSAGCDMGVMEASSQGFKYDRTLCCRFAVGIFTNIGEDHISDVEHPTFEDYFSSKLRIFDQCETGVVNLDADHASEILARAQSSCAHVLTYSMRDEGASIFATPEHLGQGVWRMQVRTPSGELALTLRALGAFNVSNALAALAACEALGVSHDAMARGLSNVAVPGRMERYDAPEGDLAGIVDYAHNEMSMRACLSCLREEFPDRELTVVFGSCGTRATHRRHGLGLAAGELADRIILTEDEPGDVPVEDICAEIGQGVIEAGGTYEVIVDRAEAIRTAVATATRPAVLLLAGKGVEDTMLRAHGSEPYDPDAAQFCHQVGVPFAGYEAVFGK